MTDYDLPVRRRPEGPERESPINDHHDWKYRFLSLSTTTGRISALLVVLLLTLSITPFILTTTRPAQHQVSSSAVATEAWPTAPASYLPPVPPPAGPLRAQPTAIPLPRPEWHEMSHLTVIEFMQSSVVDIQRTANMILLGDLVTDRLLLKATGKIQLGLDLGQVRDVQIDGKTIQVTVPKPEILSVELLPDRSQIFAQQQMLFLSNYTGLETEALEMARRQLRAEVLASPSMMKLAEEYGRLQLTEFLRKLGYTDVAITYVEGVPLP